MDIKLNTAVILLLIIFFTKAYAENEFPYHLDGTINTIRFGENVIDIDDELFEFVPYAQVHKNSKYPGIYSVQKLVTGMNIGVKLETIGQSSKKEVITEIWLLD